MPTSIASALHFLAWNKSARAVLLVYQAFWVKLVAWATLLTAPASLLFVVCTSLCIWKTMVCVASRINWLTCSLERVLLCCFACQYRDRIFWRREQDQTPGNVETWRVRSCTSPGCSRCVWEHTLSTLTTQPYCNQFVELEFLHLVLWIQFRRDDCRHLWYGSWKHEGNTGLYLLGSPLPLCYSFPLQL